TLGGAPRFGRVTQPGLRNRTRPCLSSRGTCVCPCRRTSTSSGGRSGGRCCSRNFNLPRARSTTSGHSKLLVAVSAHNNHGRSNRPELVENRFRANIAKMPDLISVFGHLRHALRQAVMRVRENKDAFTSFHNRAVMLSEAKHLCLFPSRRIGPNLNPRFFASF